MTITRVPIKVAYLIGVFAVFLSASEAKAGEASVGFQDINYARVNEGAGTVSVTVLRRGDPNSYITVKYRLHSEGLGQPATPNVDYEALSGLLAWRPDDFSPRTITFRIMEDTMLETSENFHLSLYDARSTTPSVTVSIWQNQTKSHEIIDNDASIGDINLDCKTNNVDLNLFLQHYNSNPYPSYMDINHDGWKNETDLNLLKANLGQKCP